MTGHPISNERRFSIFYYGLVVVLAIVGCGKEHRVLNGTTDDYCREAFPADSSSFAFKDYMLGTLYSAVGEAEGDLRSTLADSFATALEHVLSDPASLDYPFDSLAGAYVHSVVSDDGTLRLFWWIPPGGGSLTNADIVGQWTTGRGEYVVRNFDRHHSINDAMPIPHHVWHVRDSLYLVSSIGRLMGSMSYESVRGKVFTDTGVSSADIAFHYAKKPEGSVRLDKNWYLDHRDSTGSLPELIHYDPNTTELSFPEIIDTTADTVYTNVLGMKHIRPSGDTIRLRFDGRNFVPVR